MSRTSALQDMDGSFELTVDPQGSRVLATVRPPRRGGAPVSPQAILSALHHRGVVYGLRPDAVLRACQHAGIGGRTVAGIVVAMGLQPEDGRDAEVRWRLDQEVIRRPIPMLAGSMPDYFRLETERYVRADQQIAAIVPADPGKPGMSVLAPVARIQQRSGVPLRYIAGPGVQLDKYPMAFVASEHGFVSVKDNEIRLYAAERMEYTVGPGPLYLKSGGVLLRGALPGAQVTSPRCLAVNGVANGAILRSRQSMVICCARDSLIIADGDIFLTGDIENCSITAGGWVRSLGDSCVTGGMVEARLGIDLSCVEPSSRMRAGLAAGSDFIGALRPAEIAGEIAELRLAVGRIDQVLDMNQASMPQSRAADPVAAQKRLAGERRRLELKVRALQSELRTHQSASRETICERGASISAGRTLPGVEIRFGRTSQLLDEAYERMVYTPSVSGNRVHTVQIVAKRRGDGEQPRSREGTR